jgi:fructose-bisphosphate aldolase class I
MSANDLASVADAMVFPGKGVIAIDESVNTCNKRFEKLGIAPEVEQRRAYRELLLTTPRLGEWISGAILFDETIRQSAADGRSFVAVLEENGVLPGIKVDTGTVPLPGAPGETITEGLDGLPKRIEEYRGLGARFAKWRAVLHMGDGLPSDRALAANAYALARYARICQDGGLVPIVEPELLTEGAHSIGACYDATRRSLQHVFEALSAEGVNLRAIVLKPNMVTQGSESKAVADVATVAAHTVDVLAATVPPAVAGIAFLSGGQDDILATQHLQAMNELPKRYRPWPLTFSYGRAIQQAALNAWSGHKENVARAQELIALRSQCNAAASTGSYTDALERRSYSVAAP